MTQRVDRIRTIYRALTSPLRGMYYKMRFNRSYTAVAKQFPNRLHLSTIVKPSTPAGRVWELLKQNENLPRVSFREISLSSLDAEFRSYFKQFEELYSQVGNGKEKAIEHALTLSLFQIDKVRRYCDVASSASPIAEAFSKLHPQIEFWKQDLKFQTDFNQRIIGGFAQSLKEIQPGFFDLMGLHCSFEHFEGGGDSEFLQEVDRVLSSQGVCLIVPLYLDKDAKIFFDPTCVTQEDLQLFDSEAKLFATYDYRQRHGRYYGTESLITRLLSKKPPGLQATLLHFTEQEQISSEIYLSFGLVLHRSVSIFK